MASLKIDRPASSLKEPAAKKADSATKPQPSKPAAKKAEPKPPAKKKVTLKAKAAKPAAKN